MVLLLMRLLEIVWHVTRIAVMQGAGEEEDSGNDSDGDSIAVVSGPPFCLSPYRVTAKRGSWQSRRERLGTSD